MLYSMLDTPRLRVTFVGVADQLGQRKFVIGLIACALNALSHQQMALFLSIKKENVDKDMYCYRGTGTEHLMESKGWEIIPIGLFKSISIRNWTKEGSPVYHPSPSPPLPPPPPPPWLWSTEMFSWNIIFCRQSTMCMTIANKQCHMQTQT